MTNPANLKNKTGQGLLETVLILPVAIAFICLLLFVSYRALLYFYVDHTLHEAMICTDANSRSHCSRNFEKKVSKIVLKKEQVRIELYSNGFSGRQLKGKISVIGWKYPISITKVMNFPLKGDR
ncbi:hypothetical protein [Bdellovibrio sp. HCB209]|uniref:hypothetical protein n=1 Tax=Bdellovibrio sp. HCB209 TaxID=3394354 RepID=UPI0039B6AE40